MCFFYLLKSINDWFSKIMRFHINTGVGEEFQLMGLGRTMQWSHHKIISFFPYCFHFCSNECKSHVCREWVISKLFFHCFLVADMRLYTMPCRLVRPSIRHISEFRAVFAVLLLPNRPRLDCRVSGLVPVYDFVFLKTNSNILRWFDLFIFSNLSLLWLLLWF